MDGIANGLRGLLAMVVGLPRRVGAAAAGLVTGLVLWAVGLPRRAVTGLLASPSRVWTGLVGAKRVLVGTDPRPDEAVFSVALSLSVVGLVGAFLVAEDLAPYPLLAVVLLGGAGWVRYQPRTAKLLTVFATVGTVLTLGFITYFLFEQAWGPISEYGAGLLAVPRSTATDAPRWFFGLQAVLPVSDIAKGWHPAGGHYSLLAAAWSTVIVTLVAGAVSAPLGVLGALFIAEIASDRLRELIKPAVEILAGIPSIVYGFIGFAVLNSFVQDAFLDAGASFLIAGLVVGVMALPTTVSVAEDALTAVPDSMSDGAVALGATDWQTMKSISIPAAFSGISAGIILGLGRAIGETMAVAAIMGAGTNFARPLYDVFDQSVTLTSRIATSYGSASGTTVEVLFVAGVMLFGIVAGMSVVAQYVERRMRRKLQGDV